MGCPCSILFCWREDRVEWGEPELAGWMSCFLRWGDRSWAWKRAEAGREREAVTCGQCHRRLCYPESSLGKVVLLWSRCDLLPFPAICGSVEFALLTQPEH